MLTNHEMLFGILLPLVVALVIGLVGWWTKRAWLLPLAGGLGFLAGYASSLGSTGGFGLPGLHPSNGTDWLFWTTLPAIGLSMLAAWLGWRPLAILGAWAGVVVWAILRPLVPPGAISAATVVEISAAAAVLGVIVVAVHSLVAARIGHGWSVLSLCVVLGGTGVMVLSSNLRTVGVYGIGAAAAVGGLVLFAPRLRAAPAVAILGVSILCGLLAGGRFYPDPGVSAIGVGVLVASPLLALAGLVVPSKRAFFRGIVAVLAVTIAVAAVTAPAALAAKRAAEADPYSTAP